LDAYLISYTKINLESRNLIVEAKCITLLEENIGAKVHDIEFGKDFLYEKLKVIKIKPN
jgi:hypothetical protein